MSALTRMLSGLWLGVFLVVVLGGCNKDDDDDGGGSGSELRIEIEDQTVALGSSLRFKVPVEHREERDATLRILNAPLPKNATYDRKTRIFRFTPSPDQVTVDAPIEIEFMANDGIDEVTKTVAIEVTSLPADGPTRIRGLVRDSADSSPLEGVHVDVLNRRVETNAQGRFTILIPDGASTLDVDGTVVEPGYAFVAENITLLLEHELYPGQINVVPNPIYIPQLGPSAGQIDPNEDSVLRNESIGVELMVERRSATGPDGEPFEGDIFMPEVPRDRTPAALPENLAPAQVIAIQPAGILFDPPARVTFPNRDELAVGTEVEIWSIDPALGQFTVAGIGEVREKSDGTTCIETTSGGVRGSSWHIPEPRGPSTSNETSDSPSDNEPNSCGLEVGSRADARTGNLRVAHQLPGYRVLNQWNGVELVYNSTAAFPCPIVSSDVTLPENTALPVAYSSELEVGGVTTGFETFTTAVEDTVRQSTLFDATTFPTGRYRYSTRHTSHYQNSSVSTRGVGMVLVNNETRSPFGAGWTMAGLERLHQHPGESVVTHTDGRGAIKAFSPQTVGDADPSVDLAFVIDGSGSISGGDFRFQIEAIAEAVRNPQIIQPNGSVALTVIQFSSTARVELEFTVLDSEQTAEQAATIIENIRQLGSGTALHLGVDLAVSEVGAGRATLGARQVMCATTDGFTDRERGYEAADNAVAAGFDEIDAIAIGNADLPFLEEFVRNGVVVTVANFEEFVQVVPLKLRTVIGGSPPGDFSYLIRESDGSYTRNLPNGTTIRYRKDGMVFRTADRNGNETRFAYDGQKRLTSIKDPTGRKTVFRYGGNGLLSEIEDPVGRKTLFAHDANGNLVKITGPDGSSRSFRYDQDHILIAQVDERGFETEYASGLAGRFVRSTRPDGSERGLASSQVQALVANPDQTSKDAPAPHTLAADVETSFTDGHGNETRMLTHRLGSELMLTDPLGRTTTIERDDNGLPVQITHPAGRVDTMRYDARGNLLFLDEAQGTAEQRTTSFLYESDSNRIISMKEPLGEVTLFQYDARGNLKEVEDPTGVRHRMAYGDPAAPGMVTEVVSALGTAEQSTIRLQYDQDTYNLTHMIDPIGGTTRSIHDRAGNVVESIDAEGLKTQYQFDDLNQLVRTTSSSGGVTQFRYDASGNLTRMIDPEGQTLEYRYDKFSRVSRRIDPSGASDRFVYDRNGRLVHQDDRRGKRTTFRYDAAGQLIKEIHAPGTGAETTTEYAYDDDGRLTAIQDPDSRLTMTYTLRDELATVSTAGSSRQPNVVIEYGYDLNGNRVWMRDSLRGTHQYFFDRLNRLQSLTNPSGASVSFNYDSLGRRTETLHGNGTSTEYEYDAASRVDRVRNLVGATSISEFNYNSFDPIGRRRVMNQTRTEISARSRMEYQYDLSGQLTRASHPRPGQSAETFRYDLAGNRVRRNGEGSDAQFGAGNRLVENARYTFAYDGAGNLTRKTEKGSNRETLYKWDLENQLVRVDEPSGSVTRFGYDGLGRRIWSERDGQLSSFIYDGDRLLLVTDDQGSVEEAYTHGPSTDNALILDTPTGSYFIQEDGLGSVTSLTDGSGSIVDAYLYDSFGQVQDSIEGVGSRFSFTGRERDETGLYYYRARYYDPEIGRFLSEDPLGYASGDLNSYRYVFNDPVNLTDPTGLVTPWDVIDVGFFADSAATFYQCPSLWNGGVLLADTISLLPLIPSLGYITRADDVLDATRRVPDFVVTPGGTAFPVPKGADGPFPVINNSGNRTGTAFTGGVGGTNGQVDSIRIMDPTPPKGKAPGYPNGYVKYENAPSAGKPQGVNPYTGQTGSKPDTHFPIDVN